MFDVSTLNGFYRISIFNVLFPRVAKLMTNKLETHASESNKQASLYLKIVLFRLVSTALIFYMIIPFTDIISYGELGLLKRIYLQFESDIVVGNLVPLLDPVSPYLVLFKVRFAFLTNPFNIIVVFLPLDRAH